MALRLSILTGTLFLLLFTLLPSQTMPAAAQGERCFPETGICISGPIRAYWERNGGLAVFGFPIRPQGQTTVEGRTLQAQWFERDRLEIQPSGLVTAGRLGVEYLERVLGQQFTNGNVLTPDRGCIMTNPNTGYQICGAFATYWQRNGGIERFGLPVTTERTELIEGRMLVVQYFERRRFELHGNQVLLGLLGSQLAPSNAPANPTPTPAPAGCPATPNNINAAVEPGCGRVGTVFYTLAGGFFPGEWVGVYVTAPNSGVIGSRYQFRANSSGRVYFDFDSDIFNPLQGVWAITFEGTVSGRRAIAYFTLQP